MTLIHWYADFDCFHYLSWTQPLVAWMPFNQGYLFEDHQLSIFNRQMIMSILLMEGKMTSAILETMHVYWSYRSCFASGFWWCWSYTFPVGSYSLDHKMSTLMVSHSKLRSEFCYSSHLSSLLLSLFLANAMSSAAPHFQLDVFQQPDLFLLKSLEASEEFSDFVFWSRIIKLK